EGFFVWSCGCSFVMRLENMNNSKESMFSSPSQSENMNTSKESMFPIPGQDENMNNSKESMFSGTGRARALRKHIECMSRVAQVPKANKIRRVNGRAITRLFARLFIAARSRIWRICIK
ncbi:MAG: hypothetical protein WAX03_08025, partial [Trichococcus flocculiformis]